MAVMGRKKKAIGQAWNAVNKQRDEESRKLKESTKKDEKVSEEEHQERIKLLKSLGLVK